LRYSTTEDALSTRTFFEKCEFLTTSKPRSFLFQFVRARLRICKAH
jgi:hypothetical protein